MGKLPNGPFGPFNGKVGNLISYQLNGQTILRHAGTNSKPASIPQKNNRLQMKVISNFFYHMDSFLIAGFGPECKGTYTITKICR